MSVIAAVSIVSQLSSIHVSRSTLRNRQPGAWSAPNEGNPMSERSQASFMGTAELAQGREKLHGHLSMVLFAALISASFSAQPGQSSVTGVST